VAVKLRLMRMGKKKQPTYRVVAADSRKARNGRIIEAVGFYDPRRDPSVIEIDNEKAVGWLRNGAQPTERVEKLLKITGAWDEFKGQPVGTSVSAAPASAPVVEAPAEEAAVVEAPAEEAAVVEAPVEEAPAEEAPVEEAPAEEAAVVEAPVEEAPVEEAAAEEEAPAEEAAAEEAVAEETVEEES
jgi:small subunit ribosomal protein S16